MKRVDPKVLANKFGVDLDAAQKAQTNGGQAKSKANGQGPTGEKAETEEFDLDSYPTVKAAVFKNGPERSGDTYGVMAACFRASLPITRQAITHPQAFRPGCDCHTQPTCAVYSLPPPARWARSPSRAERLLIHRPPRGRRSARRCWSSARFRCRLAVRRSGNC